MSALVTALLETVYPPECAACGERGLEPFCLLCRDALMPAPPFTIEGAEEARAVFGYGGPIADAVHRLKYRGRPDLARPLGALLAKKRDFGYAIDAVVPVPTTRRRAIRRGYNHAALLADHLDLPVHAGALVRTADRPQVGLQRQERLQNLAGAFAPGPRPVQGRTLLLVDDVVTTGATATAAVRALRSAGARRVFVLALAREG